MLVEIWKDIVNHEDCYQVSNTGKVRNKITNIILRPSVVGDGYYQIHLSKNGKKSHLLIHCLVFDYFSLEKRNGRILQVDHIDNNKLNNRIDNLQLLNNRANNSKKDKVFSSIYSIKFHRNIFYAAFLGR